MPLRTYALASAIATATMLAFTVAASAKCITKGGAASGITKEFAQYEAELIIRQVTGNWPIQTDKISKPAFSCKSSGALWYCRATAKVCKG